MHLSGIHLLDRLRRWPGADAGTTIDEMSGGGKSLRIEHGLLVPSNATSFANCGLHAAPVDHRPLTRSSRKLHGKGKARSL